MNPKRKQEQHSVRRIVLPSGKCIEVVRFADVDEPTRQGLHVCPECACELVQPVSWGETGDDCWELILSCPNCWWSTEGVFDRDQINELEEELDQGLADMLRDLQRLTHANMSDQIERFINALHADLILPEDF
jgi:hypothetical protein